MIGNGIVLVRSLLWAFLLLSSFHSFSFAAGHGDEDPFPLKCANFSGHWRADSGERYSIQQRQCSWLRVQFFAGSETGSMTIVPDNRVRPGPSRNSSVRHRWNSSKVGKVIESHRLYMSGGVRVSEVTMFEQANDDLLLVTTYRKIEYVGMPERVRQEVEQEVLRRTAVPKDADGVKDSPPRDFR